MLFNCAKYITKPITADDFYLSWIFPWRFVSHLIKIHVGRVFFAPLQIISMQTIGMHQSYAINEYGFCSKLCFCYQSWFWICCTNSFVGTEDKTDIDDEETCVFVYFHLNIVLLQHLHDYLYPKYVGEDTPEHFRYIDRSDAFWY